MRIETSLPGGLIDRADWFTDHGAYLLGEPTDHVPVGSSDLGQPVGSVPTPDGETDEAHALQAVGERRP